MGSEDSSYTRKKLVEFKDIDKNNYDADEEATKKKPSKKSCSFPSSIHGLSP
jgi:hypothetical protein